MNTLLKGEVLNARYQVIGQLKSRHRDFGLTYLAKDLNRSNGRCVLKEFAPRLQRPFELEKAQMLFEREAGNLYQLQHSQVPKFYELLHYSHKGRERLLLVQDYVEGRTYQALFNERTQSGRRFSETEVRYLLCLTLPVLNYIHSMGVIHGDIFPQNLILRSSDKLPVLIGFGSIKEVEYKAQAQLIEVAPNMTTLPLRRAGTGRSGYAPPEQVKQGIVFEHSDLYALAAIAVALLTGKKPQHLIEPDTYRWIWQGEIILSPQLEKVLMSMLSPNPSDRFGSAAEVIQALQESSSANTSRKNAGSTVAVSHGTVSQEVRRQPPTPHSSMSNQLSSKVLFAAPLAPIALLLTVWGLRSQFSPPSADSSGLFQIEAQRNSQMESQLSQRFSQGEHVLIAQTTTPSKELAVAAFAQGNYEEAASFFSRSLKSLANDPESLIYLNNAQIGDEKSYSIAVSVPIGSNVDAAQEILRGVAQAQNQVNQAGGINRIPLRVQIVNDDNDPEVAKQTAAILGQNPDILGVVGHYASDVTLAAANIYQSDQLVAISPISTSVELSNLSPYLFRTVPSDYVAGRALANYALEALNEKNVSVFYNSQSNYSKSLKSEFSTAVSLGGGQIVSEVDLSDEEFNAVESFNQALKGGAEALMLAANTDTLDEALQVVQVNRRRLTLLAGDDVYTSKTLEVAGGLARDMVLAIPWHIKSNPNSEFIQVSRQLWGANVNWRTVTAYDATSALIAAIDQNPSRTGIQSTLAQSSFSAPGAVQQITFLSSGDRLSDIQLVTVQPSESNLSAYNFEPILPPTSPE